MEISKPKKNITQELGHPICPTGYIPCARSMLCHRAAPGTRVRLSLFYSQSREKRWINMPPAGKEVARHLSLTIKNPLCSKVLTVGITFLQDISKAEHMLCISKGAQLSPRGLACLPSCLGNDPHSKSAWQCEACCPISLAQQPPPQLQVPAHIICLMLRH